MYPDRLYDLALAFRKTKLWKKLCDSELFAVSLSNGQIGYCCVMGALGEHIALSVYMGEQGLDSYRLLQEMGRAPMDVLKAQEFMLSQSCLQCSLEPKDALNPQELAAARGYARARGIAFRGANAFPQFVKYQPARYPWPVLETADMQILCETLAAALAVSEKLTAGTDNPGFSDGPAHDRAIPLLTPKDRGFDWGICQLPARRPARYPEPKLQDELLIRRLKKQARRCGAWVCDTVMLPQPACADESDPDAAPVFPYMLLAANPETGLVISTEVVPFYEDGAAELLLAIGNRMLDHGIPSEIQVVNDRTQALLKDMSAVLNIRLVRQRENEFLDRLEEDIMNFCDEQTPDMAEDAADDFAEMLMFPDDDMLLSMPDDMKRQLRSMERQGLFPEDLAKRIRRLF